jgi:menaquinol-cytochrome c reductase iron-sulfur subunit
MCTTPADDSVAAAPVGRRSFVTAMFVMSAAAVSTLLAIPLVRFATYPLRQNAADTDWTVIGPADEYASLAEPTAKTITLERRDAWQKTSSQTAVYVLPAKSGEFRVLSPVCPHLGCSVRWVNDQNMFVCPCHSGTFSADGTRLGGPPPRSMDSLESKVEDGMLKVRYQYFRQLVSTKEVMA